MDHASEIKLQTIKDDRRPAESAPDGHEPKEAARFDPAGYVDWREVATEAGISLSGPPWRFRCRRRRAGQNPDCSITQEDCQLRLRCPDSNCDSEVHFVNECLKQASANAIRQVRVAAERGNRRLLDLIENGGAK
jgi:hypothetical protein